MPSASNTSNSSNIQSSNTQYDFSVGVGSRLVVVLPNTPTGFIPQNLEVGDVIRYDIGLVGYTRSSPLTIAESEVFGVVETVNGTESVTVVIYGAVNIPSHKLINVGGFNYGGNDIYFLSSSTPGSLQNLAPTTIGQVVKPVYQIAPNGENLEYTGILMNYNGYVIQG